MIKSIFVMATALMILLPSFAIGEEQIRDQNGVVIEIRQQHGNMSYAYDGNRNLRYVATSIPGNQEVVEYRDKLRRAYWHRGSGHFAVGSRRADTIRRIRAIVCSIKCCPSAQPGKL